MTENMKKCLELMDKDDEARNKLAESGEMTKEQFMEFVIAYGAKNGITLTGEDFSGDAELTDDELDAVAGGMMIGRPTTLGTFSYQCPNCGSQMRVDIYIDRARQRPGLSTNRCRKCGEKVQWI